MAVDDLYERWAACYRERLAGSDVPEIRIQEMAHAAALRGDEPPPLRRTSTSESTVPTASDVVIGSVGYVGAAEAWDLRRRLMNGGLSRLLDFFPGQKEQFLNLLGMLGGIGGMATIAAAYFGGGPDAKPQWEAFAAAYAAFHYSAQQFSKRLAADRQAREQQAVTIAASTVIQKDVAGTTHDEAAAKVMDAVTVDAIAAKAPPRI